MKAAVRAIIIDHENNNLMVMKRDKFGSEYYTLIGGHVELNESFEKALYREVHEETMVRFSNPRLVYIEEAEEPYGMQYIYLCKYISGTPMLHPNSDEKSIGKSGDNVYTPMWIPISRLPSIIFRSENLKQKLIDHIVHGFPDKTIEFSSIK